MIGLAFSWLLSATPVWLSLCVIAACAALAWQIRMLTRRVDRHARSIAHMDEWADSVDHTLQQIEGRARRAQSPAMAPRQMMDARKWWQK